MYQQGTAHTTSPDAQTDYGFEDVLAKRTFDPATETLVEEMWHASDHRFTTFTLRVGEAGVYDVTDDRSSFSGTVHFEW